ncbi:hypothetical protein [Nocardia mexicana]|uniref:Uncharacterized protein n=1 Tax=Nocardia mexicana TaxID=279262 RepID=A0A370H9Z3_9NOCA|nr:hypothetical protein [Nocardia mexicana]RDI51151.1 hypothetical protein DFR68_105629 [Nocardia mexicana]
MPTPDPVLHRYPAHAMSPAQMHHEINGGLHSECTLNACEMLRGCWTLLIDMGHLHPTDLPEDCPVCGPQYAAPGTAHS